MLSELGVGIDDSNMYSTQPRSASLEETAMATSFMLSPNCYPLEECCFSKRKKYCTW